VEFGLVESPRLDAKGWMQDHVASMSAAKSLTTVAWFAVDVQLIVADDVEWDEWLAARASASGEKAIEHALPCFGVERSRLREHTVKVEEARLDAAGQSQPGLSHGQASPTGPGVRPECTSQKLWQNPCPQYPQKVFLPLSYLLTCSSSNPKLGAAASIGAVQCV
jgi:hypothetical protein